MRIALDAMGGDYAPKAIIEGALLATQEVQADTQIVLVGHQDQIHPHLAGVSIPEQKIHIEHAAEQIEMAEHPMKAFAQKPNSSIALGYRMLKERKVDAFCSAGNTGAMLVGAIYNIKIDHIARPAIMSYVPQLKGNHAVMLDIGANTDCKPETLNQFGELGSVFYKHLYNVDAPRVALINLGEEEEKGNIVSQATYKLLKNNTRINFVGNVEGRDLFKDKAEVLVCDGFIGNVIIKMAESYYEILKRKNIEDPFFDNFNFESIGGSPVLGVDGNVIIGHGVSNATTIKNMLLLAERMNQANIHERIRNSLESTP